MDSDCWALFGIPVLMEHRCRVSGGVLACFLFWPQVVLQTVACLLWCLLLTCIPDPIGAAGLYSYFVNVSVSGTVGALTVPLNIIRWCQAFKAFFTGWLWQLGPPTSVAGCVARRFIKDYNTCACIFLLIHLFSFCNVLCYCPCAVPHIYVIVDASWCCLFCYVLSHCWNDNDFMFLNTGMVMLELFPRVYCGNMFCTGVVLLWF